MQFITDPATIEKNSMEIIAPYLVNLGLPDPEIKVFSRIIHAAGDPDYSNHIKIHPAAIAAGIEAIKNGADIFCDVEMVRTGINKNSLATWGGTVHSLIADPDVAEVAKYLGITRSMAAVRAFGERLNGAVVAIGNAPTALFEVIRLMTTENIRPALIVGVPVGFVGAAESKKLLFETSRVPYVTVLGTKGGSPIAAATVDAILYLALPRKEFE